MGGWGRALLAACVLAVGACTPPPPVALSPTPSPTATVEPTPRFDSASYQYAIQQRGKIRVGVSADSGPFSHQQGTIFKGFDPDIARELAKGLFGRPAELDPDRYIEWVPVVAATRISVLTDDKADVVVATLEATVQHAEQVALSDPYFISGDRVMVMAASDVATLDDLHGKTVCTMTGSENEKTVVAQVPGVRILSIDSWQACAAALAQGQTDAVSAPETILLPLRQTGMRILGGYLAEQPFAVGVRQGRAGMISFVNSVVVRAISNGRWADIYKQDLTPFSGDVKLHPHDAGRPTS